MKVMFVGDVCLGEYYLSLGHGPRTHSKTQSPFSAVQHIFNTADFVVGNLEAPITGTNSQDHEPESMTFKAHPRSVAHLRTARLRVMQVANNHTVQHGADVFDETLALLRSDDIQAVGLVNQSPIVIEENGIKVGFLAASDVPDNTDKQQAKYQRLDDNFFDTVEQSVDSVDHLIVLLHWGLEASTSPLPYQRDLAKRLRSAGVRAVVGCHPHIFYEIRYEETFVCAYSLGNFVFDLCWDRRLTSSGILELSFEDGKLSGKVWPVELKFNGALPTPSGAPVPLIESTKLYELGTGMRLQTLKKFYYLLKNIFEGRSMLKLKFLARKLRLIPKFRPKVREPK